jgi:glycosyltransferase involved in cell wall biosynthesis
MFEVLIDATPVTDTPSGVGFYVLNLIQALARLQSQESFSLQMAYQPRFQSWAGGQRLLPRPLQTLTTPVRHWNLPVRLSSLWMDLGDWPGGRCSLNLVLNHVLGSPTIVHGTNYSVYPCPGAKRVMTIYDLTCIRYPEYVDRVALHYAEQIRRHLRWTDLVITISENSKRDIVEFLGVEPDRIWVTPLASSHNTHSPSLNFPSARAQATRAQISPALAPIGAIPIPLIQGAEDSPALLLERPSDSATGLTIAVVEQATGYDLNQPYLLFVSTIEPRKNLLGLIRAFEELRSHYKIPHNLVLVGRRGWRYEPVFEAIGRSPWREHIYHLNYLSDAALAMFYRKADVFVYPSHYEGFGLPILEAMEFGVPVVTSNTSSLPEVAGDAALYASPQDSEEIAARIFQVLTDADLRHRLMMGGKEQAKRFSWETTARQTLAAYQSLV